MPTRHLAAVLILLVGAPGCVGRWTGDVAKRPTDPTVTLDDFAGTYARAATAYDKSTYDDLSYALNVFRIGDGEHVTVRVDPDGRLTLFSGPEQHQVFTPDKYQFADGEIAFHPSGNYAESFVIGHLRFQRFLALDKERNLIVRSNEYVVGVVFVVPSWFSSTQAAVFPRVR